MRFAIFYTAVMAFLLWRWVWPLKSRLARLLAALFVLIMGSTPMFIQLTMGGIVSPEAPRWMMLLGMGMGLVVALLAIMVALREVLVLVTELMGRRGQKPQEVIQSDKRVALGMAMASTGLALFGMRQGIAVPEVTQHRVYIEGLDPRLEGLRLVQLSDLHASSLLRAPHMAALVERVNQLDPDLILITGDVADGTVKNREEDVAPLANLKARYGVFACEGNHEHYLDYDHWMTHLPELGMRLLRNAHEVVWVQGAPLVIGGLTDPMARRFGRTLPNPAQTWQGAPHAPRILLAHQPRFAPSYFEIEPYDVMLSGHTHGGQAPGMDVVVSVLNNEFVRGWYWATHQAAPRGHVFVHSGSGLWNGFPIRLGIPSEIALITLTGEADKANVKPQARPHA